MRRSRSVHCMDQYGRARMTLLTAIDVGVRFGGRGSENWAVRSASLEVAPNEMVAIVGASGSGKSTLLYALAGLQPLTTGSVAAAGVHLEALSSARLARWRRDNVGFVFQSYNLVPYLTVRQNVELPARLAGRRPDATSALATVGLLEREDSAPGDLSGGQQQRIALARVLASAPSLIFADEPTGALDSRTGHDVMERLRALPSESSAVILVTHDVHAAARADRAVVMSDGCLVDEIVHPTADQLYRIASGR